MGRWGCIVGLAAGAVVGCSGAGVFNCVSDAQCAAGSVQGTCESTGFCSFPDDDCTDGRRYGDAAGDGLAGECVVDDPIAGTGSGTTGPPPATTTGPASSDGALDGATTQDPLPGTSSSSTGETPATTITVTFGDRGDADFAGVTRDSFVRESPPTTNGGAHGDLHLSEDATDSVALLHFDVSAIAPGTRIVSAQVQLFTPSAAGAGTPDPVSIYALLEDWEEGTGDQSDGIANWTERTSAALWTNPGVGVGSREPDPVHVIDGIEPASSYDVPIPTVLAQTWVDDPSANYGLALQAPQGDQAWFGSRESSDELVRPLLELTYVGTP